MKQTRSAIIFVLSTVFVIPQAMGMKRPHYNLPIVLQQRDMLFNLIANQQVQEHECATIVDQTLNRNRTILNLRNYHGESLLMVALKFQRPLTIAAILKHNPDVNEKVTFRGKDEHYIGYTALFYFISYIKDQAQVEFIGTLLMEHGADPTKPNNEGRLPLCYAIEFHNIAALRLIVNYALSHGYTADALFNTPDQIHNHKDRCKFSRTVLQWARDHIKDDAEISIIDELIRWGADDMPSTRDPQVRTQQSTQPRSYPASSGPEEAMLSSLPKWYVTHMQQKHPNDWLQKIKDVTAPRRGDLVE